MKTHCKYGHLRTQDNVSNSGNCRECLRVRANEYYKVNCEEISKRRKENPEATKLKDKKSSLKKLGWTIERVTIFRKKQKNLCAICGETLKVPYADHKHIDPPQPRGLLCPQCNFGLGNFKDDPKILEKATKYLMEHESCGR